MDNLLTETNLRIELSGINIGFICNGNVRLLINKCIKSFISDMSPNIIFNIYQQSISNINFGIKLLDASPWTIYFNEKENELIWSNNSDAMLQQTVIVLKKNVNYINVYLDSHNNYSVCSIKHLLNPTLLSYLLSSYQCLVVHSCGIKWKERGWLFSGKSGVGKSTICKLLSEDSNITPLCDDRIIIRYINDNFYIYGTPWFSSANVAFPTCTRLNTIYFIYHSKKNIITGKGKIASMASLISNSYLPMWDYSKMNDIIKFTDMLTNKINCYDLGFFPDSKIVNFLRSYE